MLHLSSFAPSHFIVLQAMESNLKEESANNHKLRLVNQTLKQLAVSKQRQEEDNDKEAMLFLEEQNQKIRNLIVSHLSTIFCSTITTGRHGRYPVRRDEGGGGGIDGLASNAMCCHVD